MKEAKKETMKENEEIADARAGAVVPAADAAVSTEVAVSGAKLDFPFIRLGQGMSQWKTAAGKKPVPGCFYIGKGKDSNVLIADSGHEAGIYGIVLEKVEGFKEDRVFDPANTTPPKRWIVGAPKPDGEPATREDCLEAAAKEGLSLAAKPTGKVWASGRPVMRANLSPFCYLCMLVPLPEDFESNDYRLVPIGDRLYTTARYEFDRQYYKKMVDVLSNIEARETFAHRNDKGYAWTVNGLVAHLYSTEVTNKDNITYIAPAFEKALRDGKPFEFTDAEKRDFAKFLLSVKETTANLGSVSGEEDNF